jgi:hypothetical protein
MKTLKAISIDKNVADSIRAKKEECGFNFSEWVEKTYKEQFLNIDILNDKKQEYINLIQNIDKNIEEIKQRKAVYDSELSTPEKRYLLGIPRLVKEGKNIVAITKRFNVSFNRKWSVDKVMKTIKTLK